MKKEEKAFFLFEELSGVSEERLEEARLYGTSSTPRNAHSVMSVHL